MITTGRIIYKIANSHFMIMLFNVATAAFKHSLEAQSRYFILYILTLNFNPQYLYTVQT